MPTDSSYILIIDDDRAVCTSLRIMLRRAGYEGVAVHHPREVAPQLADRLPELVLLDMNFSIETSGDQGLKFLRRLRETHPQLPVILMTGWATVQLAVEGMKLGARDFVAKPWDNKELLKSIHTILALRPATKVDKLAFSSTGFSHIIGQDVALQRVLQTGQQVAPTDASVLITGESGTGKELVAEAIHATSQRAKKPFVKVNLGGIPESLFESELFGHVRGAFTDAHSDRTGRFALADGGTIFLDEIGDLPLPNQVKLLRVLQERTFEVLGSSETRRVDVRVIAATNKDLPAMVQAGSFREDLFYRINLITLRLPPLRQRPGDIPLLVSHFLERLAETYQRPVLQLTPEAKTWLSQQSFPGNIRQLQNLVERVVLLSANTKLGPKDFMRHLDQSTALSPTSRLSSEALTLEELEVQAIKRALSLHEYNITAAAQTLGITRSALYRRLDKYGIAHVS